MTVNLEELLLRENKKLVTPQELLLIREYETHSEMVENDALSRVGLNSAITEGLKVKIRQTQKQKQTENFKQERVFHISQIQAICEKYYLRFLETRYYAGTIDKELPTKITNFEAAYQVNCHKDNTMICAPVESFNLQAQPKDPLLFYRINSEYFYLIHKWGNDLSLTRRVIQYLSNPVLCGFIISFIFTLPLLGLCAIYVSKGIASYMIISAIVTLVVTMWNVMAFNESDKIRFFKENDWDSPERRW